MLSTALAVTQKMRGSLVGFDWNLEGKGVLQAPTGSSKEKIGLGIVRETSQFAKEKVVVWGDWTCYNEAY